MLLDAAHNGNWGAGLVHEFAEAVNVGNGNSGVVEEVGDGSGVLCVVEDEDECYVTVCASELGDWAEGADVGVIEGCELVAGR